MFSHKSPDVSFSDYAQALSRLCRGSTQDKLLWTFKVCLSCCSSLARVTRPASLLTQLYDINSDERITLDEVEEIARAIYALLGYYVSPPYDRRTSQDRARLLFSKLDPHNKSFVTKDDFIRLCSRVRESCSLAA